MRKFTVCIIFLIVSKFCIGQSIKSKLEVVKVIQQRSIYLNGGVRSTMGGKSRVSIPIQLPEGTVSWYYSFSTTEGESGIKNLNLFAQLASIAIPPLGISKSLLSSIEVPKGSNSVDIYLFDAINNSVFLNKEDNEGANLQYFPIGSVKNTTQAVVDIKNFNSSTLYLGLKNPSLLDAVNIVIEVVALVQTTEEFTENENRAIALADLGWKAFERGDYDRCITLSKQACKADNSMGYIHFNLGISYLMKGKLEEAIEEYTTGIVLTKKSNIASAIFASAVNDLKAYMSKFPSKQDAEDVLFLLNQELN